MDPAVSYSQNQEQTYILEACRDIAKGRFLDIGAFHPKDKSNTRALYELGWSGVLIDPGPKQMRSLLIEHGGDPRIDLVCAAVGLERGFGRIHATDDGTSTTEEETYHRWREKCHYLGEFFTVIVTLEEILNRFGAFDFVNIDTEGTSFQTFKTLLATEMFPRCICVEYDDNLELCDKFAEGRGYTPIYLSGENAVYTRGRNGSPA